MKWNRFFSNDELTKTLADWQKKYPKLLKVESIGLSHEKQKILLATITNREKGSPEDKPAFWLDANIHSTEIVGTTAALHLIFTLVSKYRSESQIMDLVDRCTFYIVPRVNPDGAALAMAKNPKFTRSGVRPYPWAELEDGIHESDIDGDGRILQMRVADPNGEWKQSSLHKSLLEKRGPDEHGGKYYRLYSEGLIEDYDGYVVKHGRPLEGLDFNRNFPFEWRPEGDQYGAGPYPSSEPEVRALVDFISKHPNINAGLTYHTFGGVLLRPYSTKADDAFDAHDLAVYKRIGARGKELTGYPAVSVFHDFKYHPKEVVTGVFDDWLYDHFGAFTFTVELWDVISKAGIKERKFIDWFRDHPHEHDLKIFRWAKKNCEGGGYIDWYKFKHPQLGEVELGGWDHMRTWRNPPPAFVEEECAKNTQFALAIAAMLPHLEVPVLEVEEISANTFRINLVVENSGFFPTFTSQQAIRRRACRPVRLELTLPKGTKLKSGRRRQELRHLNGRSASLEASSFGWFSSAMDCRARAEWVIEAKSGSKVKLSIKSERAGNITKDILLENLYNLSQARIILSTKKS
jgi:murein tripeptide amidase MpaA